LTHTKAFQRVRSTREFLMTISTSEAMENDVRILTDSVSLSHVDIKRVNEVLAYITQRSQSHNTRAMQHHLTPIHEVVRIWSEWKSFLERLEESVGSVSWDDDAGAMQWIRALSTTMGEEDAVWLAYWHWVYLVGENPTAHHEYRSQLAELARMLPLTRNLGPRVASDACDRGFRFWYTKAEARGVYNVERDGHLHLIKIAEYMRWALQEYFGRLPTRFPNE